MSTFIFILLVTKLVFSWTVGIGEFDVIRGMFVFDRSAVVSRGPVVFVKIGVSILVWFIFEGMMLSDIWVVLLFMFVWLVCVGYLVLRVEFFCCCDFYGWQ